MACSGPDTIWTVPADPPSPHAPRSVLELAEGDVLIPALDALLKGVLESEVPLHMLLGPARGPFHDLREAAGRETTKRLFASHGCRLEGVGKGIQ